MNDLFSKIFLALSWILFFCLFFAYIYPIGHLSDDYVILERAQNDQPLWTIHYSLTLPFLWKHLDAYDFKVLSLLIHLLNCLLFYRLLIRYFEIERLLALFGATFFLFSAAGMEALAWNCCLGYLLTAFFLLLSLNITKFLLLLLPLIQLAALLTWDWGVLITPMCFLAAYFKRKNVLALIPSALILVLYLVYRSTLGLETVYGKNSLPDMVKFFMGSPLLILLPNMDKSFFASFMGIAAAAMIFVSMLYVMLKVKESRPAFAFLALSLLPWVIGGHPSSRYYYLAAPFLAIIIIFLQKRISSNGRLVVMSLLMAQVLFFLERAELWHHADNAAFNIGKAIQKAYKATPEGTPFVVVNGPDAYGAADLPMRPQVWHLGLETFCKGITEVKIKGTPFVWNEGNTFLTRAEIKAAFNQAALFEVVLNEEGVFSLAPFQE